MGTVHLLGEDASEAQLRAHLPEQRRWRAVHFACHGLIDPERPTLSSLALTRSGDDDGFLTAAEVIQMNVKASLVVLSACETATGRIVSGEGVVGLTRAFMYAGAPRIICSLWKVDDEATKVLMLKFYELWSPHAPPPDPADPKDGASPSNERPSAAEALQQAQAFVRNHPSHPAWSHPYYWAAWVLWGLPD